MKKALALVLALMMVMSIIPMVSSAATTVTATDLYTAAANSKTWIETNKKIPATVTVGGTVIPGADFFMLMCKQVDNLGNGASNALTVTNVKAPDNPASSQDSTNAQVMKADFVNEAKQIVAWSAANGNLVPNYSTMEAGVANYNSMFYMYTKVLNFYKTNGALPNYNTMIPWKEFVGSSTTATTAPSASATTAPTAAATTAPSTTVTTTDKNSFTVAEIAAAAAAVRDSVVANKAVPETVKVGNYVTSAATYLRMMVTAVGYINAGDTTTKIYSKATNPAPNPVDSAISGNIVKAAFVNVANGILKFIEANNNTAPNYSSTPTTGKISYYSAIYNYSKILAFYNTNKYLPNYNSVQPWKEIVGENVASTEAPTATVVPSTTGDFTFAQIIDAASRNKTWIASNKSLPNYTTINGKQVKMPDYLYMIAQATVDSVNGITTNKYSVVGAKEPAQDLESISSTVQIYKKDYADMASRLVAFMKANSYTVSNYCTYNSSTKVGYESLVYMYSRILAYYKDNNNTHSNYCTVSSWDTFTGSSGSSSSSSSSGSSSTTTGLEACPSGYEKYTVATTNCQVNNSTIKSVSKTARGSATTQYKMGFNIFNYLQNNTSYWYSYENTKLGALQTWNKRKGNCCDLGHLAVAVWRASGVPARYYHAQITSSGGSRYGHVWAQCYLSGSWYHGDLSNSINTLRTSLPQSVAYIRVLNGTYITLPF